jgi:hypothetical protein
VTRIGAALSIAAALVLHPSSAGEIVVTTTSDAVNGAVTSAEALAANPGPDGISLPEAIQATNQDPGEHAVRFATALRGKTIVVGRRSQLPGLEGGNVDLSGDIDGDGRPDVTIRPATRCGDGFNLYSGGNRLHALALRDFGNGVVIQSGPRPTRQTYAGNELSKLVVDVCTDGIRLHATGRLRCEKRACATHNRWRDLRIVGNTIESRHAGIELALEGTIGDRIERLTISGNRVHVGVPRGREFGGGIGFVAGAGFNGTRGNRISDVIIANNTITGNPESAIRVAAGDVGSDGNTVERVRIVGNKVNVKPGADHRIGERSGVVVATGDGSSVYAAPSLRPIRYSEGNVVRDVEISGNRLAEGTGLNVFAACCGSARNALEKLRIRNNTIFVRIPRGVGYGNQMAGVYVVAGTGVGRDSPDARATVANRVHDLSVTTNRITIVGATAHDAPPAGVYLVAGEEVARGNRLTCLRVSRNRVRGRPTVAIVANADDASRNTAFRGGC